MKFKALLVAFLTASLLSGCAAIHTKISKSDLEVQTKMTDSIFLQPVTPDKRTILVQVRNTSDKPGLDIAKLIRQEIKKAGYTVVQNPAKAYYMLQANILQVGEISPDALEAASDVGWGGAAAVGAGAAVGAVATESWKGGLIGGLLGGAVSTVANAMVEDVTYSIITDLQISERFSGTTHMSSKHRLHQGSSGGTTVTYSQDSNWRRYQTRILSSANKADLEFSEALPKLKAGLVHSISGIF